ncbi:MAG TPA: hypothetical protein VHR45_25995 [Thermoanaerobaculia bacterium]|nr:hypothetical protein [Thermoanaerobaculia bacterium]
MRHKILLIAALTLSLGLSRSYAVSAEAVAAPAKGLDEVNRALRWRTASIALVSGRTVPRATRVRVDREKASWWVEGKKDHAPIADVRRIETLPESRAARLLVPVGVGLVAGAIAGYALGSDQTGGFADIGTPTKGKGTAVGAALGGAVGAAIGVLRGKREGEVVYEGPVDRLAGRAEGDEAARGREAYLKSLLCLSRRTPIGGR